MSPKANRPESDPHRAQAYLRAVMRARPSTPAELWALCQAWFELDVSRTVLSPTSTPPLWYVAHGFFGGGDAVIWACRGGGKTLLGALVTVLELVFKPGIQIRILGGSLEQSQKMYEHMLALLDRPALRPALATAPTQRRILLENGSRVELLAGSQRSVRGVRVHRLRCDEVDEFTPELWHAAQLVTRSGTTNPLQESDGTPAAEPIRASVEALSTMHRPGGLMGQLVDAAHRAPAPTGLAKAQPAPPVDRPWRAFTWNAMDVAARCPESLPCQGCVLWDDCQGRAKQAQGFIPITDLLDQRRRTSDAAWASEMMCQRPSAEHQVYAGFDENKHVQAHALPSDPGVGRWIGGMDFGIRSPGVFLWGHVLGQGESAQLHIADELAVQNVTLDQVLSRALTRSEELGLSTLDWVGVDPAGAQRNSQTGLRDTDVLRARGLTVRAARASVASGIERIRRRLDRGTLTLHPRCTGLIAALRTYHFDPDRPGRQEPVKDGPDHLCDALRYLVQNLEADPGRTTTRNYLR